MNAASVISRMALNTGAVAAIIRKDLRALWPFALALAALLLVMNTLFRVTKDYPDVMLDFGASQLHLAPVLFLFHMFALPVVAAIFIVMLVHQDPATDARNDWMVRPIGALDLVAAKSLVVLAVVLLPLAIGNFVYVTTHDDMSIGAATGPIVLTLIGCIFMLVVAWLASSPVQALLAPLVLTVATLLLILSLGLTIGAGVIDTSTRRQTAELSAAADARQLSILALKREVLEVRAAGGTKFVHRFFDPGESYIPRVGSGWTVSTLNGAAFEWRIGGRSLGLLAESGPANALSVDIVARTASLAPPEAPPAPELPGAASPSASPPEPQAAPDDANPAVEEPAAGAGTRRVRRLDVPERTATGFVDLQRPIERPTIERPERVIDLTWPILIAEFLLMLGAAGVVLWLLLVRRRLSAARMTFLGFFGAATLLMLLQGSVSTPRDQMIVFESIAAAPVSTRPAPPEADRMAAFAKHDANGDQKLDKTEYAAVLAELGFSNQLDSLWMQRDRDMDGFVSAQEYRAAIPAVPGRTPAPDPQRFAAFTAHDANKDRKLDKAEYRAVLGDLGFADDFELLWMQRDGNEDGFISAEEYGMPP